MSTTASKNLAWLLDKLARKLNFNVTQTDQDFAGPASDAYKLLKDYLNEAYRREVAAAKVEIGMAPFRLRTTLTWSSSSTTLTVPAYLIDQQIIEVRDETSDTPGPALVIGEADTANIYWQSRDTLRWGNSGPGYDVTLGVYFVAAATEMLEALSEPWLIPPDHRDLLLWSAAVIARAEADERVPGAWMEQRDECRSLYHSLLSRKTVTYPLPYTVVEPGFGGSFASVSTTAGIGGGIG
jgi:hypothetical protein